MEQTSCAEEEKGRGTDIQCRGEERTRNRHPVRTEKVQLILNFKVFFSVSHRQMPSIAQRQETQERWRLTAYLRNDETGPLSINLT